MMDRLVARGEAIAREAKRARLQQLAAAMQSAGVKPVVDGDRLAFRGRGLMARMLGDPLLRFARWSRW